MPHVGKRFRSDLKAVEGKRMTAVPLTEAVATIKSFKKAKFDQSIEMVLHLGIDPKQADQMIRGSLSLPHGVGKSKRVICFCTDDKVAMAKAAGAIEAGGEELVKKIEGGWMDFDVAIASPDMMRVVSRLGKSLGPKGLMPSPKTGTVTPHIEQAVKEYAAGKLEFRNDDGGNVHAVIGKHSMEASVLEENAKAFIDHINRLKPSATKGHYIKKIALSATMSPSVLVQA